MHECNEMNVMKIMNISLYFVKNKIPENYMNFKKVNWSSIVSNFLRNHYAIFQLFPLFLFSLFQFIVVQSFSHVQFFVTTYTAAHQASLSFTISQSLLILKSTESMMPSNHLILCHLLLLPSIFSSIRVFSNELALSIRWSKYWSFNFSISPFTKHLGFISFRIDNSSPCCPRDSKESSLAPQF